MRKLLFFSLAGIFIFIIFSSLGLFGSNVDVCAYRIIGNSNFRLTEFVGGRIATLTYKSNYIAPIFTSSLLFISFFFYINKILKKLSFYGKLKLFTNSNREIYSLSIATSSLLIWPFYPYLVNALRQGVALSFSLILMNILISDNFKFKNLFFLLTTFLLAFSHKSGLLVIFSLVFSASQNLLINKINFNISKKKISLITSIIAALVILFFTNIYEHGGIQTIGFDLGIPLMIFSIIVIILLLNKYRYLKSIFPVDLFNMSLFFSLLIILLYKNSFVTERFLPYLLIIIFPIILEIFVLYFKQTIATIFILIFMGFSLTFVSGQYRSSFQHAIEYGKWCSKID